MDLFFGIAAVVIAVGYLVLLSFRKSMKTRLEQAKNQPDTDMATVKPAIVWVIASTVWGILSVALVAAWFTLNS